MGSIFDTDGKMINRILTLRNNLPLYWRIYGIKGMISYAAVRYGSAKKLRRHYLKGIAEPIFLRCDTTDPLTMREVFLDRDYDIETDGKVEWVVDAGANIGLSSVFFANKYPEAKILAIEPEEENFNLLKKNVAHYPQVIPIHAALWNYSGEIQLSDPGRGAHGYVTLAGSEGAVADSWSVPCVTLRDLISRFSIPKIDLLKVDIEGAEREVFEDSLDWIDKVVFIIVELHERFKPGCTEALNNATPKMNTILRYGKLLVLKKSFY